ncbi:RNA-binding protein 44 [Merluccius polli]|uniref:RNA-binding protein 44 n=1 Tax=Merluccius polli TaxID=89951 RepID=A0AA47M5K1_MERPO|nr:RNA-binding protein 44 [Merluccius polli]
MVTVTSPRTAEVAVERVNGVRMQGSTLHVEHIRLDAERRSRPIQHPTASGQVAGALGDAPKPTATKAISRTTIVKAPPRCCPDEQKALDVCPTAKGTCTPQHYATMGSFDKMMARLTELHPEAGRQAVVHALREVKSQHRGVLSGLPLSDIVEMASKQLAATSSSAGATAP